MGAYDDLPSKKTGGAYDDLPDSGAVLPGVTVTQPESGFTFLPRSGAQMDVAEVRPEMRQAAENPYLGGTFETAAGLVPTSLEDVKHMLTLPRAEPIDVEKENRLGAEWRGEYGPEAQARSISGSLLAGLPLLHLPFAESPLRPTPRDLGLADQIRQAAQEAAQPPPIPPEYAERRFTIQPEPPPDIAPAPPIEGTLANIPKEPPVFNPELGPQTIPESPMPLRTEPPVRIGEPLKPIPFLDGKGGTPAADVAAAQAQPQVPPPVEIPIEDRLYAGGEPARTEQPSGAGQPTEPNAPGIANRYIEEAVNRGELPPDALVHGVGTTPAKSIAESRARIAANPNVPFEAARRLTQGYVRRTDVSDLHAYNDMLAESAAQARQAAFTNPGDATAQIRASNAEQAHQDFLKNVLPKAKGIAQQVMVGFQDAVPPDFSTYEGMYKEAMKYNKGEPLSPAQRSGMYKRAEKTQRGKTTERAGLDRQQKAMDATMPRTKVPDKAQMQSAMDDFIKRATPCV